eukprot:713340-Rhodomonas_salina.1
MKEGEDYVDAFTPVPHATSGWIIISLAAAMDLELHSCNLAQAFIQASAQPPRRPQGLPRSREL